MTSSNNYPVPWYLRPLDTVASMKQTFLLADSTPTFIAFSTTRNEAGYPGNKPQLMRENEHIILASLPELDYPFEIDPAVANRVTIAGPISPSRPPVAETNPDLAEWLRRRPTVVFESRQKPAASTHRLDGLWRAVQMVLDAREDLQVLWRLEECDDIDTYTRRKEFGDRLRVHRSLDPRPVPVLTHAEVPCLVASGHYSLDIAMR